VGHSLEGLRVVHENTISASELGTLGHWQRADGPAPRDCNRHRNRECEPSSGHFPAATRRGLAVGERPRRSRRSGRIAHPHRPPLSPFPPSTAARMSHCHPESCLVFSFSNLSRSDTLVIGPQATSRICSGLTLGERWAGVATPRYVGGRKTMPLAALWNPPAPFWR
jgi:hypothetical protein